MFRLIFPVVSAFILTIIITIIVSRDFKNKDIKCPRCNGGKVITVFGGTWECLDCKNNFSEQEGIYDIDQKR